MLIAKILLFNFATATATHLRQQLISEVKALFQGFI